MPASRSASVEALIKVERSEPSEEVTSREMRIAEVLGYKCVEISGVKSDVSAVVISWVRLVEETVGRNNRF